MFRPEISGNRVNSGEVLKNCYNLGNKCTQLHQIYRNSKKDTNAYMFRHEISGQLCKH